MTALKMLLCNYRRYVCSLFTRAAVSEGFLVLFTFQIVLPCVLIFAFESRNHYLILWAVNKQHITLDI